MKNEKKFTKIKYLCSFKGMKILNLKKKFFLNLKIIITVCSKAKKLINNFVNIRILYLSVQNETR